MRTRVKICGLTNKESIDAAVDAGADALGFVFFEKSPRNVSIEQAKALLKHVPGFVSAVALVVNADIDLLKAIDELGFQYIQFHGDETGEQCRSVNTPYIKAVRVNKDTRWQRLEQEYFDASLLLLDAYVEGVPGGTGQTFDWQLIPQDLTIKWALAGGINPENVKSAVKDIKPFAIDVSGGVERSKGIKDLDKIRRFINQIKEADHERI